MDIWATDCHVHFYAGYDIDLAVSRSWKNIQSLDGPVAVGQCWCLASPPGTDGLDTLRTMVGQQSSKTRIVATRDTDGCDVVVLECDAGPVVVVPGTQAISKEGLEVLSLGAELPDIGRMGLAELVDRVRVAGGLPIVPWGVGKWLGRRGKLVSKLIQDTDVADTLLLADNANRPWWWPLSALLRQAATAGIPVVTGSDPLPIPGDEERIASAGVYCSVNPVTNVWQQIREALLNPIDSGLRTYGKPMSSARFWKNQIRLRVAPARS